MRNTNSKKKSTIDYLAYFTVILFFSIFLYIVLSIAHVKVFSFFAEKSIDNYIDKQGLTNEAILEDSGMEANYLSPYYSKTIIFKNNPKEKYHYEKSSGIVEGFRAFIPFYNFNKIISSGNSFEGVTFTITPVDEYNYNDSFPDETSQGKLDENGNIIEDIHWKSEK